tara:strand:+ start:356 stop:598 length:243 start_codon:yes stop_codon:yes gene_type:complete
VQGATAGAMTDAAEKRQKIQREGSETAPPYQITRTFFRGGGDVYAYITPNLRTSSNQLSKQYLSRVIIVYYLCIMLLLNI